MTSRKERLAAAGLKQYEEDVNDVLWDENHAPQDPGKHGEYSGYFQARYPWVEIDTTTNDVTFSSKLTAELSKFSADFLSRKFDLIELNGQRSILFNFSSKKDFNYFTSNCTIPLRRLYGRATEGMCGSWEKDDLLNILNWFGYPVELDEFHIRRLGDLRKELDNIFKVF